MTNHETQIRTTIEVFAGLAAGVVFILLFAIFLPSNMSVDGLRTTYRAGEQVDFSIKVRDWDPCIRPSILVRNENTKEMAYITPAVILTNCFRLPHETNVTVRPVDIGPLNSPIIINETGSYKLAVSYGEEHIYWDFTVIR